MDNLIGKTLDGLYTIQELIGAGGMANVYKAVVSAPGGPVPEGTVVAVKVLRQELMHDADLVRRFKNESKAISLLNHPNIVKVYDVSVSENLQYIVMECVEGMTLREYLNERGGKITSRETVHFIAQILRALDHAHRNGHPLQHRAEGQGSHSFFRKQGSPCHQLGFGVHAGDSKIRQRRQSLVEPDPCQPNGQCQCPGSSRKQKSLFYHKKTPCKNFGEPVENSPEIRYTR